MLWILLAPGESLAPEICESVRNHNVGVITSAFLLAPWASFVAATDQKWWLKYPESKELPGRKFSPWIIPGVEQIKTRLATGSTSSGVLGLECARILGAEKIVLLGFDHKGSHFFGPYTNGLSNTKPSRRLAHEKQFLAWKRAHKKIEVVNYTPGSALKVFPISTLEKEVP